MKKILMMGLVAMAAMVSQASYLFWQVQYSDASKFASPEGLTVNSATLYAVDKDGESRQIDWADIDVSAPPAMPQIGRVDFDDLKIEIDSTYSFYIELSNYNATSGVNATLAFSETARYTDLEGTYIVPTFMTIPPAWSGGTYSAPEPTSGMLLMVGLGLLALRRRDGCERH